LSGTIEIEGDRPNTSLENLHIRMTPLDAEFMGPWPGAKVEKDGTFALSGVLPGRWCLSVENIQGHIKSLTFGGQEAHSCAFAVAAGGALQVVVSTKMAEVEGTLQGTRLGDGGLVVILAPEDEDRVPGAVRTFPAGSDGRFRAPGIAPGRYRLYGAGNVEAAALQQNPRVLKALAGRGTRVELEAGGKSTAQAQILSTEEVNQAFLEVE
jgi:hypothetical protein